MGVRFGREPLPIDLFRQANLYPLRCRALFAKKRGTGYESYIGVPLLDEAGEVIGHIAVYSSKPRDPQDYSEAFLRRCAFRAEA